MASVSAAFHIGGKRPVTDGWPTAFMASSGVRVICGTGGFAAEIASNSLRSPLLLLWIWDVIAPAKYDLELKLLLFSFAENNVGSKQNGFEAPGASG